MRKKIKEKVVLKHLVWTRINTAHYERLQKLLAQSHHKTMSELLRNMICNLKVTILTRDESIDVVMEEITRIRTALNGIGNNINQATRQIHQTADKSKVMMIGMELKEEVRLVEVQLKELFPMMSKLARKWLQE